MILRRIGDALRRQDWFAVVLEFLIVVLGVVIGFQVSGWGAERADRRMAASRHSTNRYWIPSFSNF